MQGARRLRSLRSSACQRRQGAMHDMLRGRTQAVLRTGILWRLYRLPNRPCTIQSKTLRRLCQASGYTRTSPRPSVEWTLACVGTAGPSQRADERHAQPVARSKPNGSGNGITCDASRRNDHESHPDSETDPQGEATLAIRMPDSSGPVDPPSSPPESSRLETYPGVIAVFHADGSQDQYPLPSQPSKMIVQFDAGIPIHPVSFDLDLESHVRFETPAQAGQGVRRVRQDYGQLAGI